MPSFDYRLGGNGEGYPPPSRLGGIGEHRELPQRGPPTHFWHVCGPQNTSGRENSVTLLNDVQSPESDMFI